MQKKAIDIIKYILSILLAVVLLYFSFRSVKWEDFITVLKECRWWFVVLAILAGAAAAYVRGLRWRLLLLPIEPETKGFRCFNAFNIGRLADFVVPHSAEFLRCGLVTTPKATYDKVFGTVLLERAWDILSLLFMILLLLLFGREKFGTFFTEKVWEPLSGSLNFSLWWIVAGVIALCIAIIWMSPKVRGILKGILKGAASCLKMENKGWFFLYTAMLWMLFLLMSQSIIWALPQGDVLNLADGFFIMLVGCIASIVPVPGGYGAFHYLLALALSSIYGIPFEMGIIFATLSHESQALMMLVIGGFSYAYESLRRSRK